MKLFNFFTKKFINQDRKITIQELEDLLITSDFGVDLTDNLIEKIKNSRASTSEEIKLELKNLLTDILKKAHPFEVLSLNKIKELKANNPRSCQIIANVGTNGVGKTTSCAKLANYFQKQNYKVALVAADTFRSGAVNQLKFWAEKNNIYFFETNHTEPSAIVYSAIETLSKDFDLILIDSAGRSINEINLMNQISKMNRIIVQSQLNHTVLLTLDGTNGLQAKQQAETFSQYLKIDGLIITKLDGTAKAGVLFDITNTYKYPTTFIGLGEKITDMEVFSIEKFISKII